jgi:hypothetical protein
MDAIYNALVLYELDHGFVPITSSYGEQNPGGGWDNSVDGGFLTFLVDDGYLSASVVDPINNDINGNSVLETGEYFYRYFCYDHTIYPTLAGVRLDYINESETLLVRYAADNALGSVRGSSDDFFRCGVHL